MASPKRFVLNSRNSVQQNDAGVRGHLAYKTDKALTRAAACFAENQRRRVRRGKCIWHW